MPKTSKNKPSVKLAQALAVLKEGWCKGAEIKIELSSGKAKPKVCRCAIGATAAACLTKKERERREKLMFAQVRKALAYGESRGWSRTSYIEGFNYNEDGVLPSATEACWERANAWLSKAIQQGDSSTWGITAFNDDYDTVKADVVAVFKLAIKLAKKAGD